MTRFFVGKKLNLSLTTGSALIGLLVIAGAAGSFLPADMPPALSRALEPPSKNHWLGCDALGWDVMGQILKGAFQSLKIGLTVTTLNLFTGLIFGSLAAIAPAWLEATLMRIVDSVMAFPGLLLAIFLASIMPHSASTIVIALALTGWTGRSRFCYGLARQILKEPYIDAAVANGASMPRIILMHVWPSMGAQLGTQAALSMGYVILAEASLSFLGLGGEVDNPSWGRMIADGREYLIEAPHLSIAPGVAFVSTVLAFNLVAEGLRQRLNASQRNF